MNYKQSPELKEFVLNNVEKTGKNLGRGAFGDVEELMIDGKHYAGKLLHSAFLDPQNLGVNNILEKFVKECQLLEDICHPNIVQFIGICFFKENPYPVLVMEKLDMSLDDLLMSTEKLSTPLKLHILRDISEGLVYLHHGRSNPIIHRDLTTRNVLINKDPLHAKIADLGNASIIDKNVLARTLTQMPGTQVYMPPEAVGRDPHYSTSLDMFSFGHLALYTINQVFPGNLHSPTFLDQQSQKLCPRSELDRRKEHIDTLCLNLGHNHAVTLIIKQCLSNAKIERPTARNVLIELQRLIECTEVEKNPLYATAIPSNDNLKRIADSSKFAPGVLEIERTSKGPIRNKKPVWKKYIFQIEGEFFKFMSDKKTKVKESVNITSITSVSPLPSLDNIHFPFTIVFDGKRSPWSLRAYSEQDRDKWIGILTSHIRVPVVSPLHNLPKPYEEPVSSITSYRNRLPSSTYDDIVKPEKVKEQEPVSYVYEDMNFPAEPHIYESVPSEEKFQLKKLGTTDTPNAKPPNDAHAQEYHKLQHHSPSTSQPPNYTYIDEFDFSSAAKKEEPQQSKRSSSSSTYPDEEKPPVPPPRRHSSHTYQEHPLPADYTHDHHVPPLAGYSHNHPQLQHIPRGAHTHDHPQLQHVPRAPHTHDHPQLQHLSAADSSIITTAHYTYNHPQQHTPPQADYSHNYPQLQHTPPQADYSHNHQHTPPAADYSHNHQHTPPAADSSSAYRQHEHRMTTAYHTYNHPQPHQKLTSPPVDSAPKHEPRVTAAAKYSYDQLTREQLLACIEAIQRSAIHNPSKFNQQDISSSYTPPKRSELYVNMNGFSKPQELPPPLPPKPSHKPKGFWSQSSQNIGELQPPHMDVFTRQPQVSRRATSISKSQSLHLHGSSAEARRQRIHARYQGQFPREDDKLTEEDEEDDQIFPQDRIRHAASSEHVSEQCPPLPPKSYNRADYQNFERGERALPKRSHTMKAYLWSEVDYRKKYMAEDTGHRAQQIRNDRVFHDPRGYWGSPPQTHEPIPQPDHITQHGHNIEDVKALLGDVLTSARIMDSDKYLNGVDDETPEWATCLPSLKSMESSTPEESLESLKQLALFIDKDDLFDMQQFGKGQFGKVYKAKLKRGRGYVEVAVKTIKSYESEHERTEFLREQAIMSQMAHPNLVRLYGLVKQESPWIVLEFLPIGDLRYFLIRNKRPIKSLVKYMLDVALGMHYISEKGFVHRDIAARNIMVGHDEVCKVGDFGLLRELPRDEQIYVSVSKSPAPIRWMAPESLERREFSTASDVWSYGVLQWEMFQPDKTPYEGMDNYQCGFSVINGKRLDIPPAYPPKVRKIMKACWHEIPAKRPSFLLIFNILTLIIFTDFA